jgi:superfamily II DNA or RNA helicase
MQFPPPVHVGDLVDIRRSRWRILDVRQFEDCQVVSACGINAGNAGLERLFLTPFESIVPIRRQRRLRFVRLRRWRHACRGVLADYTPAGGLRTAARARLELMPHQLEPALAVVRGLGSRLLLADEVGLGKTIQAGVVISELRSRAQADRVLIITPSGLRDQWRDELAARFEMTTVVLDHQEIRRRAAALRVGLNPWTTVSEAIVSIDYVKRPEVLQAAAACQWDVVVIDEAHAAGRESERLAAVSSLARRAAYVVLVTATPHSGDAQNFSALCGIGALGDALLSFRRSRQEIRPGVRRHVQVLRVSPSAAETGMWRALSEYVAAVKAEHEERDAWLGLSILYKRAFSSARSLALTIGRRLAALEPGTPEVAQLPLPLDDLSGDFDEADNPPDSFASPQLGDRRRERRLLQALHEAAERAASTESKVAALRRLLRRVREPAVVFTEFRDTLLHLASVLQRPVFLLHGGLSRDERRRAVADFCGGADRILLATDAAGEGLNLHRHCRLVINLELPWSPVRLEQRIGRVDRIGQRRTVHAVHFVAAGAGELRVLERLKTRLARARQDMHAANPLADDERAVALSIVGYADVAAPSSTATVADEPPVRRENQHLDNAAAALRRVSLASEARLEAGRLSGLRRLFTEPAATALDELDSSGPWITRARLRPTRARLGRRALALVRVDREDGSGRLTDWIFFPLAVTLAARLDLDRKQLTALAASFEPILRSIERGLYVPSGSPANELVSARLDREQRISRAANVGLSSSEHQPGLFDRRVDRMRLGEERSASEIEYAAAARLRALERAAVTAPLRARLLLVMVP